MTDTEITALAREYAEDATKTMVSDPNLSDTDIKGIKRDIAEYAEEILRFLLRRFCLVEKKDVVEIYQCANNDLEKSENQKHIGSTVEDKIHNEGVYAGKMEAIELLFPKIAKEVEE